MKTIEEKLSDYLDSKSSDSLGSPINALSVGFKDGYAEALRWRDPEKELPEQYKEVLLKSGDFRYVGYRIIEEHEGFYYWADLNDDEITDVTHWRPINMEDMG